MANQLTPHLVDLTYDAVLKSFWRKNALRKFLRECHISESFLASWASDESKRAFLDRVFEKLQQNDRGKRVIYQMAVFLSEKHTFPDLENWDDSEQKTAAATKAILNLRDFLNRQNQEIADERHKEEVKQEAHLERLRIQRESTDRQKLQSRLSDLHKTIGTQQSGYDFQNWFYDLLDYCEITNKKPYTTNARQIDGSLTHDGTTYLVELKFTAEQATAPDIDTLKAKVDTKADNTMGLMVSISSYSSTAISEASGRKTTLLLLDASHLYLFLTGALHFSEIVSRIRRHASQTGESYLPVARFGE